MRRGVHRGRVALLAVVVSSMMLSVLGRLWHLQIVDGAYYARAAADSRVRTVPLPAPAGRVLAADGRPLGSGALVGLGLETWYRAELAGRAGVRKLAVDSRGTVTGVLGESGPRPGNTLTTSIDPRIQRLAEQALASGAAKAGRAPAGAVVVLEASTGRVAALAGHAGQETAARHGGAAGVDTGALPASGALVARRPPGSARAITSPAAATAFGFGRRTGIDLPNEAAGSVPDPARHPEREPASGADDVLVTPLQLARAYAAAVNGGTLFSPRLATGLVRPDGTVAHAVVPPVDGHVTVSPETMRGLRHALSSSPSPGRTLHAYGGSGTSWSACYVAAGPSRYVVVVVVPWSGRDAAGTAARALREGIPRLASDPSGT
ncbi:hypothetical protein GCM10023194_66310 [Planotetraspora phitsanulokensis]|uniref:Penicillin-binding protein transpeptidase domain-containing protein n=1 Tax=Planotetraspora phitsanulokensis TaxID=575192 RepID=A0A8J3XG36_9ACTN|nr:penicillin-binding transpeptidase domain-containing protein [Planotetraspora phitsanulokensis]GII38706.1 hypothetical protein Pph01_37090 [Planotetraspora phitsanulokensis]